MSVTTERITAFIDIGIHTHTAKLYETYLQAGAFQTEQEHDVQAISAGLDAKVDAHCVDDNDLGEYEETARRAGFYAGYMAAVATFKDFYQRISA